MSQEEVDKAGGFGSIPGDLFDDLQSRIFRYDPAVTRDAGAVSPSKTLGATGRDRARGGQRGEGRHTSSTSPLKCLTIPDGIRHGQGRDLSRTPDPRERAMHERRGHTRRLCRISAGVAGHVRSAPAGGSL